VLSHHPLTVDGCIYDAPKPYRPSREHIEPTASTSPVGVVQVRRDPTMSFYGKAAAMPDHIASWQSQLDTIRAVFG
jgi:hypothetical protein